MIRTLVLSALAFPFLSLLSAAQTPAKPAPAPDFRNEALVFERSETIYRMHADGTGERDMHVLVRIQSQGAAQQFGVLSFSYASANESPQITLVRVHKPDGTVVDTPVTEAIDMPAAVTREAPLYSDLKEKHVPVRSLAPGDTLEYEVHVAINKAEAPGQFWGAAHFTPPGTVVVLAEITTLQVPVDKYVQVWSPNHKPVISDHDGVRTYTWNIPQLVTAPKNTGDDSATPTPPKDIDEDADGRKLPSVAWTTFHNWAEVGDWYRSLALTQAAPNEALHARADEITKDAKTPEDQVRAIYEYVSSKTRYVGIDFGVGRYQPHSASEVLANQYGDCKDKDTLLEALLRAKGFSTAPALIGAGITPVPDVPSPAVFNHVITTVNLPSGRLWLDSTPQAAPYRFLSAVIRDQKALVVPASGPAALDTTPATAPYAFFAHFDAVAALDADGKLTGKVTASYRDDDEVLVRALAQNVAPAEWDKASQYISSNTGFSGTTSNTQFTAINDFSSPIGLAYDYTRHPFGDWDNRRIVPLLPALEFTPLESDSSAPQEDIQLGAPRTLTATSRIRLPEDWHTDLPDPVHEKTDFATVDKTYRFDGKEIVVERTIVVLKSKLPKSDWKRYQSFTKDIGLDGEPWIQLIAPQKPITVQLDKPIPPPPSETKSGKDSQTITIQKAAPSESAKAVPPETPIPENASARDLMLLAMQKAQSGDAGGAREILDKVKAKNPDEEYLWSGYGMVAEMQGNYDEAKTDFNKELASHPDDVMVVGALADAEVKSGDSLGARQTLRNYLDHHPKNLQLSMYLASLQNNAQDYAGALKTLETASQQNPDNRALQLQISTTLLHLNRNEEAAAAAMSALDGADDAGTLNDAAYTLSETGLNLSVAEEASRKSIAKLEEKSASISTEEANSNAFAQANLLIAAWDTLGWILYREGKLDAAKPLLSAAWHASLRAEVGDHLGQLYEAMSQKDQAATAYALAASALTTHDSPEVHGHITESLARLKAAGAKPDPATGSDALQNLRTYKIARPSGAKGWGTYRLEITTAGVIDSHQMTGEQQLANIKSAIDSMKFPELLPADSKAHLLRSAVVSCSMGASCELVMVPDGGLQTERQ